MPFVPKNKTPSRRQLLVFPPKQLAAAAAERIAFLIRETLNSQEQFNMALSGGSTPRKLYEVLANPPYRFELPWAKVHLFWGDERCVPPEHADSNYRMAYEALIKKIDIPKTNIHRMPAEAKDPRQGAMAYEQTLAKHFKTSNTPPSLDLILLGLGNDGHTASLFPETPALKETKQWVVANPIPQLKTTRLTLTLPVINQGKHLIFLVSGRDKAKTIKEIFQKTDKPERLPAQMVHPTSGELTWMLDEDASEECAT